jgi:hypothetical protein
MFQNWKRCVIVALWATCKVALAQPPVTVLDIRGENTVSYFHDVFDYTKIASNPGISTALRPIKPFQSFTDITDIVSVNGQPVKGVWISRGDPQIGLDPNAIHGAAMPRAIADVTRAGIVHHYIEILKLDGTPIGTIMATGMNGGDPPPGAPAAVVGNNLTVVGGTGAFLGARGQAGNAVQTFRVASISEDPANRRINGGLPKRTIIHLIPLSLPTIMSSPLAPWLFHASDLTLVTNAKPAASGEMLTLLASGLGPTRPGVGPGQPFAADPPQIVNSPIQVFVNGTPAEVLYAIGYPGTIDQYQVSFRLPTGTSTGIASIQLTSAWVVGPEVRIAVRE